MTRILVVDDKEIMRDSLQAILAQAGYQVTLCDSAVAALKVIGKSNFEAILTDLKMPQMDGLAFLGELTARGVDSLIIMMTAFASIDTAVEAMRRGAYDYIQKPFDADEIVLLLKRGLDHRRLKNENEAFRTSDRDSQRQRELVGSGPAMHQLKEQIARVARSSATVLIHGESGTGKELIARAIHQQSPRVNQPFLCVNCAALSSSLLESELFGHEKGAFTGADQTRKGRFELADGGTLLLDEISEMDLDLQAKLLRVLQEREFERVGSSRCRQVDVRVIATTNRHLEEWVKEGNFRQDLYYRLNVVPIQVPSLRQRSGEDIEALADYFLAKFSHREGSALKVLSRPALGRLRNYPWPGNVRELENLMERVCIMDHAEVITEESLDIWLQGQAEPASTAAEINLGDGMKLADLERTMIEQTLERFDGHRQRTAQALGIGVRTLGMKLKRWREQGQFATE